MKKFLIIMLMVIVVVALVFNTVGCGTAAPGGEFTEVKIYAGKFGADSYLWGVGTAEILKKSSTWLRGSAEETLGGTDTVIIASQDPANSLPVSSVLVGGMARAGLEPFEQKHPDFMLMFKAVGCPTAFMSTNPDIKTKEDLIGKDIGMFPAGHSLTVPLENVLKAWGIFDKVNLKYIGPNAIRDALLDGSLEVGCTYAKEGKGVGGFMAAGWISQVVMRKKINVISVDKAACEKASEILGLYLPYGGGVPANVLGENQPEAWTGVDTPMYYCAFKQLPDEVVYEIVRCLAENAAEMGKFTASGFALNPESMAGFLPDNRADIHPGALKYYDEAGLKIGILP